MSIVSPIPDTSALFGVKYQITSPHTFPVHSLLDRGVLIYKSPYQSVSTRYVQYSLWRTWVINASFQCFSQWFHFPPGRSDCSVIISFDQQCPTMSFTSMTDTATSTNNFLFLRMVEFLHFDEPHTSHILVVQWRFSTLHFACKPCGNLLKPQTSLCAFIFTQKRTA